MKNLIELPLYQVDAFTSKLFGGNPAAVVPLNEWLDDKVLQNIAAENNLAETAFFRKEGDYYNIRWMTPETEVPLCGHATLASAFVIFNFIEKEAQIIKFISKSGELIVKRDGDMFNLDFPANKPSTISSTDRLNKCFGRAPIELLEADFFLLAIFENEEFIRKFEPDFRIISEAVPHGLIISSKGDEADFVSRMFAPNEGINEDPVTGSAHTLLVPYWSEKLGKKNFRALQVSKRGGELFCIEAGKRVIISGRAVLFSQGTLFLSL